MAGFLDRVKGLVSGRKEQIKSGIDKASDVAERRVGAKHAGKVGQAAEKAKGAVDKLSADAPAETPATGASTTEPPAGSEPSGPAT